MTDTVELKINLEKSFHRNVEIKGDSPELHLLRMEMSKQSLIEDEDYEAARVFEDFLTDKRTATKQQRLVHEANELLTVI
jgi:hypothetical protein